MALKAFRSFSPICHVLTATCELFWCVCGLLITFSLVTGPWEIGWQQCSRVICTHWGDAGLLFENHVWIPGMGIWMGMNGYKSRRKREDLSCTCSMISWDGISSGESDKTHVLSLLILQLQEGRRNYVLLFILLSLSPLPRRAVHSLPSCLPLKLQLYFSKFAYLRVVSGSKPKLQWCTGSFLSSIISSFFFFFSIVKRKL